MADEDNNVIEGLIGLVVIIAIIAYGGYRLFNWYSVSNSLGKITRIEDIKSNKMAYVNKEVVVHGKASHIEDDIAYNRIRIDLFNSTSLNCFAVDRDIKDKLRKAKISREQRIALKGIVKLYRNEPDIYLEIVDFKL